MEKIYVTDYYYFIVDTDKKGRKIRTNVYWEDGFYRAYSFYTWEMDDDLIGIGEHRNEARAIMLSKKRLFQEWKEVLEESLLHVDEKNLVFVIK